MQEAAKHTRLIFTVMCLSTRYIEEKLCVVIWYYYLRSGRTFICPLRRRISTHSFRQIATNHFDFNLQYIYIVCMYVWVISTLTDWLFQQWIAFSKLIFSRFALNRYSISNFLLHFNFILSYSIRYFMIIHAAGSRC